MKTEENSTVVAFTGWYVQAMDPSSVGLSHRGVDSGTHSGSVHMHSESSSSSCASPIAMPSAHASASASADVEELVTKNVQRLSPHRAHEEQSPHVDRMHESPSAPPLAMHPPGIQDTLCKQLIHNKPVDTFENHVYAQATHEVQLHEPPSQEVTSPKPSSPGSVRKPRE